MSLAKIFEAGAIPVSLTADGPSAHLTMMKELGANLSPENMRPYFVFNDHRVIVLLDIAHLLKLVRNSLGSEKLIRSPSGPVRWDFIEKLQSSRK
jgi:hypothetical protein